MTDASDTGASTTDNRTGNPPPNRDFLISPAEVGSPVELLRDTNPPSGVTVVTSGTTISTSITLTDSASLPDNEYRYSARETDKAGNVATSAALNVIIDTTAPTVSSVARVSPDPTSAATVDFTVTFSEPVTGVNATDFAPAGFGGLTPGLVTGVTGGPAVYTVTVNTGSGDGTLRLDVLDDDTIKDAMNLTLNGAFTTGEVFTVDRLNPFVSSITRAGSNPTNAASVLFHGYLQRASAGIDR